MSYEEGAILLDYHLVRSRDHGLHPSPLDADDERPVCGDAHRDNTG